MSGEYTLIRVRKSTVERLKEVGYKKETYDDIINRLIDSKKRYDDMVNLMIERLK